MIYVDIYTFDKTAKIKIVDESESETKLLIDYFNLLEWINLEFGYYVIIGKNFDAQIKTILTRLRQRNINVFTRKNNSQYHLYYPTDIVIANNELSAVEFDDEISVRTINKAYQEMKRIETLMKNSEEHADYVYSFRIALDKYNHLLTNETKRKQNLAKLLQNWESQ